MITYLNQLYDINIVDLSVSTDRCTYIHIIISYIPTYGYMGTVHTDINYDP